MTHVQPVAHDPRLQKTESCPSALLGWMRFAFKRILLLAAVLPSVAFSAYASCTAPRNPIEAENCLTGNSQSSWYVDGAGSTAIQGFTTDISVNVGHTVFFKINTNASAYRIDIYRLGYYQGNGARFIATVSPTAPLPQVQPTCLTDSSTGLTDCGNWAGSASWAVPATATSGIYFAKLTRLDTGEASPVIFVVRNDSSHSDILVQTCDPTWHAYNDYGGSSLYTGPTIRAFKVSYNRPFNVPNPPTWPFSAEYPMVRWLEENGYDVSYMAGVDTDRYGALITQHKIFMSQGHDEYWSGGQRANVEAARAAGVNLAFFSGNEIWWKTRWEASIDGTNTPYRTLVCYKETEANAVIDPADPPTWTGIWRDPSFSPPADGGRPENALTGTSFAVDSPRNDPITVPQADGRMRFWRNTSVATLGPGQTATLPAGVLGYEWDIDADNGFRPAGLVPLSTTTLAVSTLLLHNNTFGNGTATHQMTLYRASSGALVFGAGTVQWSWGLDATHTDPGTPTDLNMQQATVNLLADMGVLPATLQGGLVQAIASTDKIPPSSVITAPVQGSAVTAGSPVTISGTAADSGGGVVGAVEVSLDGGKTWHPAQGRENWTYSATFTNTGTATVQSRAVDDSGNLEVPGPGITVTVGPAVCPCTIWPSTASPVVPDAGSYPSVELGVQFRSESNGYITGLRYYKSASNTGTTVGNLWSSSGTLLASATFPTSGETSSGWQQVNFSSPVPITANTTYVASYHDTVGHFGLDHNYFVSSGVDNAPLHVTANGTGGSGNGLYAFSSTSTFPTQTYNSENYWVDVVFNYGAAGAPPVSVTTTSLPSGTQSVPYNQTLAATGGTAPYNWSLISGTLPAGLTLSAKGQISGTPTTVGTSSFTVQVTDASSPAQTATQPLSITVGASSGGGPISVSITPAMAKLLVGGSQQFTAAVTNDAANAGVTWTVAASSGTACSGASCGTVSPPNTASGSSTTYSAPSVAPSGGNETITATSITDNTKSASSTVTIMPAVNNVELSGDYALNLSGISGTSTASSVFAAVGRFTSDGNGNISNGKMDLNGVGASETTEAFTGTYSIGADNRGVMNVNFGEGDTARLAFVMMANGNAKLIKFDATGGSGTIGSGTMEKVDTTAYSIAKIAGDYAFGVAGLDNSNNRAALEGRFTSNGAGTLTGAAGDVNAYGSVSSMTFTSATYTVTDTGAGRGTMSFSFQFGGGQDTLNFVFYIVNAGKLFVMENDAVTTATPLLSGAVLQQQSPAGGFSNASLNGGMVIYLTGSTVRTSCAAGTGNAPDVLLGLLSGNGNGALTMTFDENCGGTPTFLSDISGTYTMGSNGRAFISVGGDTAIAYLVGLNQAFILAADSSALFGFAEPQSTGPLTNSSVQGNYAGSATTPMTFVVPVFSGEFSADGASPTGAINGTQDIGSANGPISGAPFNASYSISSSPTNGRGSMTISSNSGESVIAYVITASKFVAIPANDPNPSVWVFEQSSDPPAISSLTLNPSSVTGGAQTSIGTVTLSGPARSGGAPVALTSSNASAARVPSSLTVAAGNTSASFTMTTAAVNVSTPVTISASYSGGTKTAALTVIPGAVPPSITAQPANQTVTAGQTASFTVAATGTAPLSYQWQENGTAVPGANSSTYTTPATKISDNGARFTVTVSNSAGSVTSNSATLTVTQLLPTLSSITLNPTSVVGGAQSSTGTVTLSAPAPAGGVQVTLHTSNTGVANVPSSVTIPAGATSATFNVSTSAVLVSTSATISASYNGSTKIANLAVLL